MKNLPRKKKGFGFPEYLAYCAIASAVRPFQRCKYFAIALIRPANANKDIFFRAADAAMRLEEQEHEWKLRATPIDFDATKPTTSTASAIEALEWNRAIIIFTDRKDIPAEIRDAIDATIEVGPPTSRHVQGVFRWLYDFDVSQADVEIVLTQTWKRLRSVTRPGRSGSRVLAALKQLPAPPTEEIKTSPSNEDLDLRLENLPGYGEAKEWGLNLARDIADWRAGDIGWHDVDKGLLLSGPPGTGKTIFASALGRTCDVAVVQSSAARWQSKGHLGDYLKAMFAAFDEARKKAPCILFVDEVDSIGDREDTHSNNDSYVRQVVNGFLECLDGAQAREGVIVVGACNHPQFLDAAITRPGRLDRHIRIPLPDEEARKGIFKLHLRGDVSGEDFVEFSKECTGLTGADIEKLVREARRIARSERRQVTAADIRAVLPTKVELPPSALRANAIHEIGHAVVGVHLGVMRLEFVSIEDFARLKPGRHIMGGARFSGEFWARRNRQHYLDRIAVFMSGIAAEEVMLGDYDDGAGGGDGADLHEATNIAISMELQYGMGQHLASWGAIDPGQIEAVKRTHPELMARVDRTLRVEFERAKSIIEINRDAVVWLWTELQERRLLSGDQVRAAVQDRRDDPLDPLITI